MKAFLLLMQVKLVNIRNDDITDGNPKLTLGLIWTIILHFQVRSQLCLARLCCAQHSMPEFEVTLLNANSCCLPASLDRSCQFEQQGFVHGKNRKTQRGKGS